MKLWIKVLIGMFLGVAVGCLLGPKAAYVKPIGTMFLSLIKMVVVLLIFSSMTVGIASVGDIKKLGRVGLRTILFCLATTWIAIVVGFGLAYLFKPGLGVILPAAQEVVNTPPNLLDIIVNMIPSNPIAALAEGHVLQIIVFSSFFGIAIILCGEKAKPLLTAIESLSDVMLRLASMVMSFAPYGVFAIMCWVAGTFGVEIFVSLLKLLGTVYVAYAIQLFVVFAIILWAVIRVRAVPFFRGMSDAIALAFSTNSSSATLPLTLKCTHERLGVSKNITNFVVPLGATLNFNGAAIFQAICTIFIAQAYGIELGIQQLLTVGITATLAAIGSPGIPGGGFFMLVVVLNSVGLPIEGMAIIIGIDRLRDMASTVVNVLGDALTAVYVAKKEGELDLNVYNASGALKVKESEV